MGVTFSEQEVAALLGVAQDLHSGITYQERWASVVESLVRIVPFDRIHASTYPRDQVALPPHLSGRIRLRVSGSELAQESFCLNYEDEARLYIEHYAELDPTAPAAIARGDQVYRTGELLPAHAVGKDAMTGEFMPRHVGRYAIGAVPVVTDGVGMSYMLMRSSGVEFSDREVATLQLLTPGLTELARETLLTGRVLAAPEPEEGRRQGLVVISPGGDLEHADAVARALLSDLHDGRPPGELLASGLRRLAASAVSELRVRAKTGAGGFLELTFARVRALQGRVAVVVRELERQTEARLEAAADAAGLSTREREVAALAAQGLANKEIARALGLSLNTVKEYLSSAYRKTGADGRAALTAYLLGGSGLDA